MTRDSTPAAGVPQSPVGRALDEMTASFERFCLAAGLEVLGEMLEADAAALCGPRHGRGGGRQKVDATMALMRAVGCAIAEDTGEGELMDFLRNPIFV